MGIFERILGRVENTPQSPELTEFAQYLVDNPEIKDKVLGYAELLKQRETQYGETIYEDRKLMADGDTIVQPIFAQIGLMLPEGVSATTFLVELHNRAEEGKEYIPIWLRPEADTTPVVIPENMNLNTKEDLVSLVAENSTVASVLESNIDITTVQERLEEAGYIFSSDATNIVTEYLAEHASANDDEEIPVELKA